MSAVRTYENSERPDGWREVRLGDVVEINQRNWDPRDGAPILYLDLTAVIAPGRLDEPKELAASDAPSRARRRVLSGDILVSTVRPNLRGFARVQKAAENLVASTGFAVLTPSTEVEGSFVYHHVMTEQFAAKLEAAATGQAYPAVRPDDVSNYSIALPPQSEQRAIADVLDSIDVAIERTEAVIAATETLRDSLLHDLLTRGVPGWHTEWKDVPGIGTIPANWEVARLGNVCEAPEYGATASAQPYNPQLPRYVRITDLTDDGRLRDDDLCSADPAQVNGYELRHGDLLFARSGATVGKSYLYHEIDGPCVYAGYLIRFRPVRECVLPEFLELIAHSQPYYRWVGSMFRAGAQPNINAAEYASMMFCLPPLLEQRAITSLLKGVCNTLDGARTERDKTRVLRQSVGDQLLSGRRRIPVKD